jgi:hypothetical protein
MNTVKKRFPLFFIAIVILVGWIASIAAEKNPDYYYPNPTISTNGSVRVVLFHEGKLYVGGLFTRVTDKNGTYNRSNVAAYDMATGLVTDFKANTNTGTVRAMVAGNGKIYIGGSFTKINNVSCSKVAAVDPITGEVATGFRTASGTINGRVWALALSDNFLYLGGSFDSIDGYFRKDLASVDKDGGALNLLFDPEPNDPWNDSGKTPGGIYALSIHPKNPQIVFVGGNYQAIAGSYENPYCTVLRSDGEAATEFQPKITYPVKCFDSHDSTLYIGIGGYSNRIAAYDIGQAPYGRLWRSMFAQGDAQAVAYSNQGYVYFGFHQGLFDTTEPYRMAAVDGKTGVLVDAYPPMNSFLGVEALAAADSFLAVGGEFTQMNGLSQRYLAVLKTRDIASLPPATPILSEPADNEIGTSVYPLLKWKFAARAQTYQLGISTSDTEFLYSNLTGIPFIGLAYQCMDLKSGSRYWWKVRACNNAGKSDWSSVWCFSTLPGDEDLPSLIYPSYGTLNQPVSFTFAWHAGSTALSYGIQVSEFENFSTNIVDQSGLVDTTFHISGLANNMIYYWHVNAMTVGGQSDWPTSWFQTVVASPNAPHCVSPANFASQIFRQTDLLWNHVSGAMSYHLQLSTDRAFDSIFRDTTGVIDTSVRVAGLYDDTKYFWRVSSVNIGGEVWSSVMQFTTVFPFPCAPYPIFPANGSIVKVDSLHALWKKSNPHVTRYWIEIARDANMTGAFIDSAAVDTEFTQYPLTDKSNYWWRVRAYNPTGWSGYSETMLFKTAFPAVWEKRFSLDRFSFSRKNGSVIYSIAEQCDVHLELFDMRGKTVWKAIRQNRSPGPYKEILPASAMPVGAYFLSIKAGSFVKTADATLVR